MRVALQLQQECYAKHAVIAAPQLTRCQDAGRASPCLELHLEVGVVKGSDEVVPQTEAPLAVQRQPGVAAIRRHAVQLVPPASPKDAHVRVQTGVQRAPSFAS